jgi:hypothetical protein
MTTNSRGSKPRSAGTAVVAAVLGFALSASASLTTSESEQVRGYVEHADHADRVRALVARPDLTADESAAAMTSALAGVALDDRHMAYLLEMVRAAPTAATRPVLAVAIVRGLLARVDALYAAHPADLDRSNGALTEIGLAYDFAATQVSGEGTSMTDAARADVGKALADHVARNASLLRLDAAVSPAISRLRAQVALTMLESLPDGPTRKIDAADRLGLSGARRAILVDLGLLVLDRAGEGERLTQVRAVLERVPQAREGAVALFIGDPAPPLKARGRVLTVADATGPLGEAASPWGGEADPPQVSALTVSVARGLADAAVARAVERRPGLGVQIGQDGGTPGVVTVVAMLVVDPSRTVDVAAARLLGGRRETAAWLSDALGVLAVSAPSADAHQGLTLPLGPSSATHVSLDPTGSVNAFRLDGHLWRIEREGSGAVSALKRDGAPVALSMLPTARVPATDGSSWNGAGLVFARLAGSPRVAIAAGPRVRVVGTSVADAVLAPAPADDLTVEADLHLDGGPAGVVLHALAGRVSFSGVSLLLVPGAPAHAVLMVADGGGSETAVSSAVAIPGAATYHVTVVVKGKQLTASVGPASGPAVPLTFTLPDTLSHGDVALRAYPGVTLEVTGWKLSTGSARKR